MEINGLGITLQRINQIESNFDNIFNDQNNKTAAFDNVLRQTLNSGSPILPNEIYVKPFGQASNTPKTEIDGLIKEYAQKNNLDENLVKAVVKAESGFNPNAKSPVGAMGLMQLMPATAKNLGVNDPLDAEQSIAGGTKYLRGLLNKFDGKVDLALAAYNAGSGAVNKYGGVPPYKETENYVKKVS